MATKDAERNAARTWSWAGALAVAALFLGRGLVYLYRAHPQEDAYILFGYVRRFVAGDGIVFYPGGPHAEGATDFLWFLLLSGLHALGLDIALAAELLNAAGGALIGGLIGGAVLGRAGIHGSRPAVPERRGAETPFLLFTLLPAALAGGAIAALVGFSSLFFSGVACVGLALCLSALRGGTRDAARIPFAALLLALIRPDGVVLGAGFALVGWIGAARTGVARGYVLRCLLVAAIGAAYFLWRWSYFGLLLPLPLYAKGHAARDLGADLLSEPGAFFAGAQMNLGWFLHVAGGWPILAALVVVLLLRRVRAREIVLVLAPFALHLVVLGLARQSQNVAFRFQAPAQAGLLLALVLAAVPTARSFGALGPRVLVGLVVVLGTAPSLLHYLLSRTGIRLFEVERSYVDAFGPAVGTILEPEDKIVLCDQAGRIPYWSRAQMFDMVGLNTAHTALRPPDQAYLAGLDPDVVLVYLARKVSDLEERLGASPERVVPIDAATLAASIRPDHRDLFEHGLAEYGRSSIPDLACNVISAKFLVDSGKYDLYAVRYMGPFRHVYGLKKGYPRAGTILEALRASVRPEAYRTYAQVAGFPGAR